MPSHLRVPELTGDLRPRCPAPALTGLLRGELGFTGVIVSDALEMRATREMFGIPGAAVLAVAAGTDLLCLGRDGSEDDYLAVRDALVAAVRDGALDGARLEEAADRVARLRGGLARARSSGPVRVRQCGSCPVRAFPDGIGLNRVGPAVGLVAARRAVRVSGPRRTLNQPGHHRGRAAGEHRRGDGSAGDSARGRPAACTGSGAVNGAGTGPAEGDRPGGRTAGCRGPGDPRGRGRALAGGGGTRRAPG